MKERLNAFSVIKKMERKRGPFQIIECEGSGNVEKPVPSPTRQYDCPHYETCLDLACTLNWDNFTCAGCEAKVDESLLWRAHHVRKHDRVAMKLCNIPDIQFYESETYKSETEEGPPEFPIVSEA